MRIHRPKLKMPHPLAICAFAMIWPLCAMMLTFAATREDNPNQASPLQTAEIQADKLWKTVSMVPERIRERLQSSAS